MALAYDATRVTRDIDATFVPHGVVIDEARHVADDLGLPYWWLNEQASIYISGKDDPGKRRVFDHSFSATRTTFSSSCSPSRRHRRQRPRGRAVRHPQNHGAHLAAAGPCGCRSSARRG